MRRVSLPRSSDRPDAPRHRNSHNPTLYSHPETPDDDLMLEEDEDVGSSQGEGSWNMMAAQEATSRRPKNISHQSASSIPSVASSSSVRSNRTRLRTTNSYPNTTTTSAQANGTPAQTNIPTVSVENAPLSRYQTAFAQFTRRYRRDPSMSYEDYADDQDKLYFGKGLNDLDDSDEEDQRSNWIPQGAAIGARLNPDGLPVYDRFSGDLSEGIQVIPETPAERERLEWQTMLASVLEGDVLRMEKSRIGSVVDSTEEKNKQTLDIWLGIRARLRGRTEEEEKKRVQDRRLRTVEAVLDDILRFRVVEADDSSLPSDSPPPPSALDQVRTLLERLDVAESLYPSLKSMTGEYASYDLPSVRSRVDALTSWVKTTTTLRSRIAMIQKWTGSPTLDVYAAHTNREEPLRPRDTAAQELQDESTFVERVLKEDSLQRTFERATLVTGHAVLENARETILTYGALFREMNLPGVESELVQLIAFPTKLMEATLRVRLDYARKVNEPSVLVVDQMLDDFRLSIALACTIKSEYEDFVAPDPAGFWDLPRCISEEYDEVLLEALRFLFKLIHWKLKSASRIYLKEVEVLETQWAIFDEVSMVTEGGSLLVAEHVCSITNKLIVRIINSFESQLRVPIYKPQDNHRPLSPSRPRLERTYATPALKDRERSMGDEEIVDWYNKVLDSVRLRYRKLQRFGRVLTQRFSNSAEYSLANLPLDGFIDALVATDHLLVYCEAYEEDGMYIIADTSLRNRPYLIHDILHRAFQPVENVTQHATQQTDGSGPDNEDDDEVDVTTPYLVLVTPGDRFVWHGDVMMFETPKIELELEDRRARLVASGPQLRLSRAKERFAEVLLSVQPNSKPSSKSNSEGTHLSQDGGHDSPGPVDHCIVPLQAHHPRVDRELRRITRATNRLTEAITKSVNRINEALQGVDKRQELLANWYAFAAENGQSAQKHMDRATWSKFNRELMRLAISYVSFICDECDPTDRRTFRWAVNALEFATLRTRGSNILNLPEDDFNLLRSKVATCMTLLISHFDILGARSNLEAQREQERLSQIRRQQEAQAKFADDELAAGHPLPAHIDPARVSNWARDRSIRLYRDETWLYQLRELDAHRAQIEAEQRIAGKVVNDERPEDKSLVFLASSSSNIALRWQQGRLIGTGAFGSVYLGVNLDSGSLMAVKEIRFTDVTSLTTLYKNVKDELSVMEMLSHPNIVEYYGIEVHRDKVYIFEEYCQGGSLGALLEHGRIEDERIVQVYTLQMLEGLHYLHSKGVVHRDIKPDNILLDHMGVIKYVDFGAAKILGKNHKSIAVRTRSPVPTHPVHGAAPVPAPPGFPTGFGPNSLTGTPMYMSPEVIKNDQPGRHGAMDIWSLGCVILECVTGKKPWSNMDNEWAIMYHIGVANKHPPLPEPGQVSDLGMDFIRRCFIIDAMKRPTAAELMDHPWIAAFRDELMEYEDEEMSLPTPSMSTSHTSASDHYDMASVAEQAAKMEEKETAAMQADSPPDFTPNEEQDGILVAS